MYLVDMSTFAAQLLEATTAGEIQWEPCDPHGAISALRHDDIFLVEVHGINRFHLNVVELPDPAVAVLRGDGVAIHRWLPSREEQPEDFALLESLFNTAQPPST